MQKKCIMFGFTLCLVSIACFVSLLILDNADAQTPLDVKNLSANQIQNLRDKFYDMQESGVYVDYARLHGDDGFHCPHEKPEFLAWHRAYLIAFENALGIMVPFWDWTVTYRMKLFDEQRDRKGRRNSLLSGYIFDTASGGVTNRLTTRAWTTIDPNYLADYTYRALTRSNFQQFQQDIEAVHATVHNGIGGSMVPVHTAAFDPIFWFHHSYVNVLWSMWETLHPNSRLNAFSRLPITNYDPQGSTSNFEQARSRHVNFPHNQVFRRAAATLGVRVFGSMEADDNAEVPSGVEQHLILTIYNMTSPMRSEKIVVTFNDKIAGFYGFIGMAHRMNSERATHNRYVELTRGYTALVKGYDLHQVEKCMKLFIEDTDSGAVRPCRQKWELNWEVY